MKLDRQWLVGGIMAACVLTIAVAGKNPEEDSSVPESSTGGTAAGVALTEGTLTEGTVTDGTVVEMMTIGPALEHDQKELLDHLYEAMKNGNLEQAAKEMLTHEQKLQYLFYEVLDGEKYLYQDGVLSKDLTGTGLVLQKPTAVFFGEFQGGKPEGEGTALQVIQLEDWRYDYARGMWKDGKMEGEGETGYHYYHGVTSEESQSMRKSGTFQADLMNGTVEYETVNSAGEHSTWKLEAEQGKTVIDETWIEQEEIGEYHLLSNDTQNHVYVIPKINKDDVLWRNLLVWEE